MNDSTVPSDSGEQGSPAAPVSKQVQADSEKTWFEDAAETFESFAIGLPARAKLLASADKHATPLAPGPCQEQHTLSAALGGSVVVRTHASFRNDPIFPTRESESESGGDSDPSGG